MSETAELPSKTETEPVPVVDQPAQARPDIVLLGVGEADHLRNLEERNRFLTMLLGDKMMALDETREELLDHRRALKEAYSFVLTTHSVEQGKIDTNSGIITVLKRTPKE